MKKDNEMDKEDFQCKLYKSIAGIKWYDNKSILQITSIFTVKKKFRGSASKSNINCPNVIKFYNCKMGGVNLMDQSKSAYQLDRRLKFRF